MSPKISSKIDARTNIVLKGFYPQISFSSETAAFLIYVGTSNIAVEF